MRYAPHTIAAAAMLSSAACVSARPWRLDEPPLVAADVEGADEVRVLTGDGELLELREVHWIEDASGARLAGRVIAPKARADQELELAVADLQRAETRRTEAGRVVLNVVIGLGIAFVVFAGLAGAAADSGGFMP